MIRQYKYRYDDNILTRLNTCILHPKSQALIDFDILYISKHSLRNYSYINI